MAVDPPNSASPPPKRQVKVGYQSVGAAVVPASHASSSVMSLQEQTIRDPALWPGTAGISLSVLHLVRGPVRQNTGLQGACEPGHAPLHCAWRPGS